MIERFEVSDLYINMPGESRKILVADLNGIVGESHYGSTRIVGPRSRWGYNKPPIGAVESNWRQWSAVLEDDVSAIRDNYLQIDPELYGDMDLIDPAWLGPNIVFKGKFKGFSWIKDGSILSFENPGPVLLISSPNFACKTPGQIVANKLNLPIERAKDFVKAAFGLRGLVGTVVKEGTIERGMTAKLMYPN